MDYHIKFKTTQEGDGAKRTADDLKAVNEASKQASGSTKELAGQKKILKETLKELGHSIPSVGQLLLLLKNPVTILAGAVGTLIAAWRNYINTVDELSGKMSVHQAVSETWRAMTGAAREGAPELHKFAEELGEIADKGGDAATELAKVLQLMQDIESMDAEKRDANEAVELAGVDELEKGGQISKGDAIRSRLAIKQKYQGQREAARIRAKEEEVQLKKEATRKAMEGTVRAEQQLPGAVKQAAESKRADVLAGSKEQSDLAFISDERKTIDDREKELLAQRGGFQIGLLDTIGGIAPAGSAAAGAGDEMRKRIDRELDELKARRENLAAQEVAVKEGRAAAARKAAEDAARAEGLKNRIKTGREQSGKLFDEVTEGQRNLDNFRDHRGRVNTLDNRARTIEGEADANAADRTDAEREEHFRKHGGTGSGGGGGRSFGGASAGEVVQAVNDFGDVSVRGFQQIKEALQTQTARLENEVRSSR